jgi:hypothetical protein
MDKNKPSKNGKKNFLEKTVPLTRKFVKKTGTTEKKNQLYLAFFKIFFFTATAIIFFLPEKGARNQTYSRNRHEKRIFILHAPGKKETCKNYRDANYFKNESRHFFDSFFKRKFKAKRRLLRAKESLSKGLYAFGGNLLFCQNYNYKIFRTHNIKFYLTMLFQSKFLYSKIYKHNIEISSMRCFYHKLKKYKKNYVVNAKKFNYRMENIQEKSIALKSNFIFMFPCNDKFHRLMSYQINSHPRNKIIPPVLDFLKITGKKYEPTGTRFLKNILEEEMTNIHVLRETFNKISLQESTKTTLLTRGIPNTNFFLKFFVFELFEKIKKDIKNSLFFIGVIERLLTVIIRTNGGNAFAKKYFIDKKSKLFFDQMQWREGQYAIESKIYLYSNKKIDNKYKMSVFLIKKEELGIFFNFKLEALEKGIVPQNFYSHFYKIMMHLLNKFFVFPRGFYIEIACKCMEILKSNQMASTANFFFRLTLLKHRFNFFSHTHLNVRLFFLIERAYRFLAWLRMKISNINDHSFIIKKNSSA